MKREPVGRDWLQDFREKFQDEFPEDKPAQRAIERNVAGDRKQIPRPGRDA